MNEIGLTLEWLAQFGAGAGIVAASVVVTRWYSRLAAVGEETWIRRLDELERDYQTDRDRWNNDRDRLDSELVKVRDQLAVCTASRQSEMNELAALRAEVAALRPD